MHKYKKNNIGFTLVELLVGVAVFAIIIVGVYNAYTAVYKVVFVAHAKISAVDLANEQIEVIRNLPYASVGVAGGIPNGLLAHEQTLIRDGISFDVTTTVRNIDDSFDGTVGGTPNDLSPADYKIAQVDIDCTSCYNFVPLSFSTRVAPKNLETASTNGALFVRVFDANGNPVPQATVHIFNASSSITIDDVTNNSGILEVVDAPPGTNTYSISVTGDEYSTDSTATTSIANPNPTKPNVTVLLQQVTSQSFAIDRLSTSTVSTVTNTCSPVGNVNFSLTGAKTIGTNPVIYKYIKNKVTSAGGLLTISGLEWDTYTFAVSDATYELAGANPLQPVLISPNSTQVVQMIVQPKNPNTVLVVVKDSATGLPVSDATVSLISGASTVASRVTSKGFFGQSDWSGGSGQATSTNSNLYWSSDGNIITNSPAGSTKLRAISGIYQSDGTLTSASFDTGGVSNFSNILWAPFDQATSTGLNAVRFQIATNDDGGTWNYVGPDGTSATYFSTANTNINAAQNGKRYLRYKMYMHTDDTSRTPNISDIAFTFTSSCTAPGQVTFSGISSGSYTVEVSKPGYATFDIPVSISAPWSETDINLTSN